MSIFLCFAPLLCAPNFQLIRKKPRRGWIMVSTKNDWKTVSPETGLSGSSRPIPNIPPPGKIASSP